VSELVFGTAALGLAYGLGRNGEPAALMDEPDAAQLVASALEQGIAVFDTAPAYGVAEERLGRVLGTRGKVWTKLARHDVLGPALVDQAVASLDESLARLGRPRVDLLQWHNWTADLAMNPEFRACWARLGTDARVGGLGASTYGPDDALAAVESGFFEVVQVEWNLLNQRVVDAIRDAAGRRNVSVAVRSVFLQGALTDDGRDLPALPALRAGVNAAARGASEAGMTLQHLALSAALQCAGVRYVLVGIDRPGQLEDAVRVTKLEPLTQETCAALHSLAGGYDAAFDPRTWPAVKRS
jgi:aryl-alcohol dehydrogenase-like predicted oxidoreductase